MNTLAIDLQACQSPGSAQRGIGRYVWNLCEALWPLLRPRTALVLLASGQYPLPRRGWVHQALEQDGAELRLLQDLEPGDTRAARQRNALRYGAMLEGCDAVFIASPFEEDPGVAVPDSRDALAGRRLITLLFDLIPYRFAERYLADPATSLRYHARLQLLRESDQVLAISEASRQDAINWLDLVPARVHTIFGAVSPEFHPLTATETDDADRTQAEHGLSRPFLLYTGGDDWRKNLDGLIAAYAAIAPELRQRHQLAIVCRLTPAARTRYQAEVRRAGLGDDEVRLTGYISDAQLRHLCARCQALVFPSHYEGFGLPIAEAMVCGRPAIAADNSSLIELVTDPAARFDASDSAAMARVMTRLLTDHAWREALTAQAQARAPELRWSAVAERAHAVLAPALATASAQQHLPGRHRRRAPKPRLVFFAPIPPQASGIADYSAHLALQLARHFRITWVIDGQIRDIPPRLAHVCELVPAEAFQPQADARVLYQLGNSEFHLYQLPWLARYPGTVTLHEIQLDGLAWLAQEQLPGGIAGLLRPEAAARLNAVLKRAPQPALRSALLADALLWHIATHSQRCVVHSRHAQDLLRQALSQNPPPLLYLPHGARSPKAPASADERAQLRARWTLPEDAFIIGTYGILAPSKGIGLLVDALVTLPADARQGLLLLFAGAALDQAWLKRQCNRLRDAGIAYKHSGALPDEAFDQQMRLADLGVSLRLHSRGESSGALLQQLSNGLPTLVNSIGSFAEFPGAALAQVPVNNAQALAAELMRLRADPQARTRLADAAARLLRSRNWARIARLYARRGMEAERQTPFSVRVHT
ncbi:MAG: glycosyltransferase [Lamprobacter sp.]|uniref:glycosyltransferase n=1 Tax=Lamprobacter sp. TaxID=3100796 RepID=UPI002B262DE3|nr:glycosyltransferase [Lamprobacter sp.]MEA3638313.1 glycosyltransferase [Lamprobacter sp.]